MDSSDLPETDAAARISSAGQVSINYSTIIENAVGSVGHDWIHGNSFANRLEGGAGDDVLRGGTGDDSLDGGVGNDSMLGGAGDDTYYVGVAGDVVVELAGEGRDLVIIEQGSYTLGAEIEQGRLAQNGAASLYGNALDNLLYAGNGPGGLTGRARALDLDLAPYDWVIGVSDAGVVGHADLVVRERATGHLWLIPGTKAGFGKRRFLAEGMGGYDLAG